MTLPPPTQGGQRNETDFRKLATEMQPDYKPTPLNGGDLMKMTLHSHFGSHDPNLSEEQRSAFSKRRAMFSMMLAAKSMDENATQGARQSAVQAIRDIELDDNMRRYAPDDLALGETEELKAAQKDYLRAHAIATKDYQGAHGSGGGSVGYEQLVESIYDQMSPENAEFMRRREAARAQWGSSKNRITNVERGGLFGMFGDKTPTLSLGVATDYDESFFSSEEQPDGRYVVSRDLNDSFVFNRLDENFGKMQVLDPSNPVLEDEETGEKYIEITKFNGEVERRVLPDYSSWGSGEIASLSDAEAGLDPRGVPILRYATGKDTLGGMITHIVGAGGKEGEDYDVPMIGGTVMPFIPNILGNRDLDRAALMDPAHVRAMMEADRSGALRIAFGKTLVGVGEYIAVQGALTKGAQVVGKGIRATGAGASRLVGAVKGSGSYNHFAGLARGMRASALIRETRPGVQLARGGKNLSEISGLNFGTPKQLFQDAMFGAISSTWQEGVSPWEGVGQETREFFVEAAFSGSGRKLGQLGNLVSRLRKKSTGIRIGLAPKRRSAEELVGGLAEMSAGRARSNAVVDEVREAAQRRAGAAAPYLPSESPVISELLRKRVRNAVAREAAAETLNQMWTGLMTANYFAAEEYAKANNLTFNPMSAPVDTVKSMAAYFNSVKGHALNEQAIGTGLAMATLGGTSSGWRLARGTWENQEFTDPLGNPTTSMRDAMAAATKLMVQEAAQGNMSDEMAKFMNANWRELDAYRKSAELAAKPDFDAISELKAEKLTIEEQLEDQAREVQEFQARQSGVELGPRPERESTVRVSEPWSWPNSPFFIVAEETTKKGGKPKRLYKIRTTIGSEGTETRTAEFDDPKRALKAYGQMNKGIGIDGRENTVLPSMAELGIVATGESLREQGNANQGLTREDDAFQLSAGEQLAIEWGRDDASRQAVETAVFMLDNQHLNTLLDHLIRVPEFLTKNERGADRAVASRVADVIRTELQTRLDGQRHFDRGSSDQTVEQQHRVEAAQAYRRGEMSAGEFESQWSLSLQREYEARQEATTIEPDLEGPDGLPKRAKDALEKEERTPFKSNLRITGRTPEEMRQDELRTEKNANARRKAASADTATRPRTAPLDYDGAIAAAIADQEADAAEGGEGTTAYDEAISGAIADQEVDAIERGDETIEQVAARRATRDAKKRGPRKPISKEESDARAAKFDAENEERLGQMVGQAQGGFEVEDSISPKQLLGQQQQAATEALSAAEHMLEGDVIRPEHIGELVDRVARAYGFPNGDSMAEALAGKYGKHTQRRGLATVPEDLQRILNEDLQRPITMQDVKRWLEAGDRAKEHNPEGMELATRLRGVLDLQKQRDREHADRAQLDSAVRPYFKDAEEARRALNTGDAAPPKNPFITTEGALHVEGMPTPEQVTELFDAMEEAKDLPDKEREFVRREALKAMGFDGEKHVSSKGETITSFETGRTPEESTALESLHPQVRAALAGLTDVPSQRQLEEAAAEIADLHAGTPENANDEDGGLSHAISKYMGPEARVDKSELEKAIDRARADVSRRAPTPEDRPTEDVHLEEEFRAFVDSEDLTPEQQAMAQDLAQELRTRMEIDAQAKALAEGMQHEGEVEERQVTGKEPIEGFPEHEALEQGPSFSGILYKPGSKEEIAFDQGYQLMFRLDAEDQADAKLGPMGLVAWSYRLGSDIGAQRALRDGAILSTGGSKAWLEMVDAIMPSSVKAKDRYNELIKDTATRSGERIAGVLESYTQRLKDGTVVPLFTEAEIAALRAGKADRGLIPYIEAAIGNQVRSRSENGNGEGGPRREAMDRAITNIVGEASADDASKRAAAKEYLRREFMGPSAADAEVEAAAMNLVSAANDLRKWVGKNWGTTKAQKKHFDLRYRIARKILSRIEEPVNASGVPAKKSSNYTHVGKSQYGLGERGASPITVANEIIQTLSGVKVKFRQRAGAGTTKNIQTKGLEGDLTSLTEQLATDVRSQLNETSHAQSAVNLAASSNIALGKALRILHSIYEDRITSSYEDVGHSNRSDPMSRKLIQEIINGNARIAQIISSRLRGGEAEFQKLKRHLATSQQWSREMIVRMQLPDNWAEIAEDPKQLKSLRMNRVLTKANRAPALAVFEWLERAQGSEQIALDSDLGQELIDFGLGVDEGGKVVVPAKTMLDMQEEANDAFHAAFRPSEMDEELDEDSPLLEAEPDLKLWGTAPLLMMGENVSGAEVLALSFGVAGLAFMGHKSLDPNIEIDERGPIARRRIGMLFEKMPGYFGSAFGTLFVGKAMQIRNQLGWVQAHLGRRKSASFFSVMPSRELRMNLVAAGASSMTRGEIKHLEEKGAALFAGAIGRLSPNLRTEFTRLVESRAWTKVRSPDELVRKYGPQGQDLFEALTNYNLAIMELGREAVRVGAISPTQFRQMKQGKKTGYIMRQYIRGSDGLTDHERRRGRPSLFVDASPLFSRSGPETKNSKQVMDPAILITRTFAQEGTRSAMLKLLEDGVSDTGWSLTSKEATKLIPAYDKPFYATAAVPANVDVDPFTGEPVTAAQHDLYNYLDQMRNQMEHDRIEKTAKRVALVDAYLSGDTIITRRTVKDIGSMLMDVQAAMGDHPLLDSTANGLNAVATKWRQSRTVLQAKHWALQMGSSVFSNWATGGASLWDFARGFAGSGPYHKANKGMQLYEQYLAEGQSWDVDSMGEDGRLLGLTIRAVERLGGSTLYSNFIAQQSLGDTFRSVLERDPIGREALQGRGPMAGAVNDMLTQVGNSGATVAKLEQIVAQTLAIDSRSAEAKVRAVGTIGALYQRNELFFKLANFWSHYDRMPANYHTGERAEQRLNNIIDIGASGTADYTDVNPYLMEFSSRLNRYQQLVNRAARTKASAGNSTRTSRRDIASAAALPVAQLLVGRPFLAFQSVMIPTMAASVTTGRGAIRSAGALAFITMMYQAMSRAVFGDEEEQLEASAGSMQLPGFEFTQEAADLWDIQGNGELPSTTGVDATGVMTGFMQQLGWKARAGVGMVAAGPRVGGRSTVSNLTNFTANHPAEFYSDAMSGSNEGDAVRQSVSGVYGYIGSTVGGLTSFWTDFVRGNKDASEWMKVLADVLPQTFGADLNPSTLFMSKTSRNFFEASVLGGHSIDDAVDGIHRPEAEATGTGVELVAAGFRSLLPTSEVSGRGIVNTHEASRWDEIATMIAGEKSSGKRHTLSNEEQKTVQRVARKTRAQFSALMRGLYETRDSSWQHGGTEQRVARELDMSGFAEAYDDHGFTGKRLRDRNDPNTYFGTLGNFVADQPAEDQEYALYAVDFWRKRMLDTHNNAVGNLITMMDYGEVDGALAGRVMDSILHQDPWEIVNVMHKELIHEGVSKNLNVWHQVFRDTQKDMRDRVRASSSTAIRRRFVALEDYFSKAVPSDPAAGPPLESLGARGPELLPKDFVEKQARTGERQR